VGVYNLPITAVWGIVLRCERLHSFVRDLFGDYLNSYTALFYGARDAGG
jgi:hypothetical protein